MAEARQDDDHGKDLARLQGIFKQPGQLALNLKEQLAGAQWPEQTSTGRGKQRENPVESPARALLQVAA